ncbi:hypothetical protein CW748_10695 [Alteromonadales bacterium alter-6D02]|nr:hypothetical protein CW748_10695 [Alteromonadales bacterium alter-6D02]
MNTEQVEAILTLANNKLSQHPEYESWMCFDGADVSPHGKIIPTFKTKDGKSGFLDEKYPVYQKVWIETASELNL